MTNARARFDETMRGMKLCNMDRLDARGRRASSMKLDADAAKRLTPESGFAPYYLPNSRRPLGEPFSMLSSHRCVIDAVRRMRAFCIFIALFTTLNVHAATGDIVVANVHGDVRVTMAGATSPLYV